MRKIKIAIADADTIYLDRLTGYFVKSAPNFEVFSYTSQDSLAQALADGPDNFDILMVDEEMRCPAVERCNVALKVLLSDGIKEAKGDFQALSKYQKTADLVTSLTLLYANASGREEDFSTGKGRARLIGVYSPIGGSGKTTLSLALAYVLGRRRKKVFYLGVERVDSVCGILSNEAKMSLSDLLVAVHGHESNIELQILSKLYADPKLGFSYVAPPESSLELNEISLDEQLELLDILSKLGQFEFVVLDFDSELNGEKLRLLNRCDQIVVPIVADLMGANKLLRFCREGELRGEVRSLWDRFLLGHLRHPAERCQALRQRPH